MAIDRGKEADSLLEGIKAELLTDKPEPEAENVGNLIPGTMGRLPRKPELSKAEEQSQPAAIEHTYGE